MRCLSQIVTIARGSVGGLTWTANQFHQLVVRARTAPVQPNTTPQTEIKSAFDLASQYWDGLTDQKRADWEAYAQTVTFTGPLGDYQLSGRHLFIGGLSQVNYINATGLDTIAVNIDPPLIAGRLAFGNVTAGVFVGVGQTGIAVDFTIPELSDYVVLARRSIGFGPARLRYKGPWLTSSSQVDTSTGPLSVQMTFNGLVEDAVYFVQVRAFVENEPCRYSSSSIVRCVAVTNP